MTRVEFLSELDRRLSALSKEQADDYLAYYAEMLTDRMEDGMSEEEAVASLDSADAIAKRILGTVYTTPAKKKPEGQWLTITALAICAVAAVSICALIGLFSSIIFPFGGSVQLGTEVVVQEVALPDIDYGSDVYTLIDPDGIRTLDITWISGNIHFEYWSDDEIGVCAYGVDAMTCVNSGDSLYINYESSLREDGSGDLVVCLPDSFAQSQLDTLRISVTSADVYLYELTARDLTLTTVSGMLDVYGCFDSVAITSTSGDVTLNGSMGSVTVDSVSGNVFLTCDQQLRTLKANTVSADITIVLPEELGFDLSFSCVSGDFSSASLDMFAQKTGNLSHGDASASVHVESISGCVFLEFASGICIM